MSAVNLAEIAALGALAGAPEGSSAEALIDALGAAGVRVEDALSAVEALLARGSAAVDGAVFVLTPGGGSELLAVYGEIERALDPSPTTEGMEECPSVPWLTTVQTHWLDAVSLNYSVDPAELAAILPAPLEPEVFHGRAWVQVLASRLREMRPQGMPSLFGVNFHQVSYRAAVRYRGRAGHVRRGGYFVRSQTDNAVMRAVGNALVEFKFHEFGAARISLARDGARVLCTVEPEAGSASVRAALEDRGPVALPRDSLWKSPDEMQRALVECYDAFGVDPGRYVYVLTIDRAPWNARFAAVRQCSVPWMTDDGPFTDARLDSALTIPEPCAYRWRPLRREPV